MASITAAHVCDASCLVWAKIRGHWAMENASCCLAGIRDLPYLWQNRESRRNGETNWDPGLQLR